MPATPTPSDDLEPLHGIALAAGGFLIWGLSPVYWKALSMVPVFEILMHRIVWSFLFFLPIVLSTRKWPAFLRALRQRNVMLILTGTTLVVGLNWYLFIWAVNNDHVLQTSLGYYINPLINVLLAMVFLKERLRPLQGVAVGIAALAVLYLTWHHGVFPKIALGLGLSFGLYGLVRKVAPVSALVGLTVETMLLTVVASAYLVYLGLKGDGAFLQMDLRTDLLLAGSAMVTGLPLLLFTMGTRLIHFTTVGFLQYLAPSGTFMLAVFVYHEPFDHAKALAFALIWTALLIFSIDSILHRRRLSKTG